ncbi:hypothetical protein H4Q26_014444 [Puccinia striiformis f. sp. tritici PST-130]|nr:hypothetical protein H4Q26_014444 [Puccinia striiformis f. sp. tritici PST-130]
MSITPRRSSLGYCSTSLPAARRRGIVEGPLSPTAAIAPERPLPQLFTRAAPSCVPLILVDHRGNHHRWAHQLLFPLRAPLVCPHRSLSSRAYQIELQQTRSHIALKWEITIVAICVIPRVSSAPKGLKSLTASLVPPPGPPHFPPPPPNNKHPTIPIAAARWHPCTSLLPRRSKGKVVIAVRRVIRSITPPLSLVRRLLLEAPSTDPSPPSPLPCQVRVPIFRHILSMKQVLATIFIRSIRHPLRHP